VNRNHRQILSQDIDRLRQRVEAIQLEIAGLKDELTASTNGLSSPWGWSALRDYWARARKGVKLYCDGPRDSSECRLGDTVRIRGWALSPAGVSSVEIAIDGTPVQVRWGLERPDVLASFADVPGARESGFAFDWDTRGVAPGWHSILIRALAKSGEHAKVVRQLILKRLSDFQIFCDEPVGTFQMNPNSKLLVRGWCASKTPVEQIEFQIDGTNSRKLAYGQPRPDVHNVNPDHPVNCGFSGEADGLPAGEHQIVIAARAAGGESAVLKQNFFVRPACDDVRLFCDHPGMRGCRSVRDVVEFRGWALAWSGIRQVTVAIGDAPPSAASFGLHRPDAAREHPGFAPGSACGWRFFWDTTTVPEGRYDVRIAAVSLTGETATLTIAVQVDQSCDVDFSRWIAENEPLQEEKDAMVAEMANFERRPKISIAVPVYKTPPDLLARCIDSVIAQIYPDWELCLADDGSQDPELTKVLSTYQALDARIRFIALRENAGISAATNAALQICTGDYVGFLDSDDELADFAVWETVKAINEDPTIDLFYSDEDKIDENGRRYDWFFKPEWSPELFLSCNYLCHFIVLRRRLLEEVKALDESYRGGTQDYEFLLRAIEHTDNIKRIPKILYHWRAIEGSTAKTAAEKPQAGLNGQRALSEYMARNHPGATVEQVASCRYRVHYPIQGSPDIDIIMPTGGKMDLLRRAVEDLLEKTAYRHFQIVLIDNSQNDHVEQYARTMTANGAPLRRLDWRHKRFNFSVMNNEAVRQSGSPFVLFLNDDMSIVSTEWLSAMLEHAQRPEIGAVGAQLWYPHDAIQHAGVVMGIFGNSGHAFRTLPVTPPGHGHYFDFPWLTRNCSAVTAACLMVGRQKYWEVGGFDVDHLGVAFQDVDLCLNLMAAGYRNVYTPYAILYHYESATKVEVRPNPVEDHFMKRKWQCYIENDPYYNPNLTRSNEHYRLRE